MNQAKGKLDKLTLSTAPVRELKQGVVGDDVKSLQQMLKVVGCDPGSADGHFGPNTFKAVVLFQRQKNLNTDGVVGPLTYSALSAAFAAIGGGGVQPAPTPVPVPPPVPSQRVKGGDFSHWDGKIDWPLYLATRHGFTITKAYDGQGSKDDLFDKIREAAHKNNSPFTGYSFFRFGVDPIQQARGFFKAFSGGIQAGEIIHPGLDLEWDNYTAGGRYGDGKAIDPAGVKSFSVFANEVAQLFGQAPMIYTGRSFVNMATPELAQFPLWVFDYHNAVPHLPESWTNWLFWQYTSKDTSTGPKIDMNYFNGTSDDLKKIVKS